MDCMLTDIRSALLPIILTFLALSAIAYFVQTNYFMTPPNVFDDNKVVVFIIAHPDDECMFFAPTVFKAVQRDKTSVHLLCLTTGNFYNKGRVRQTELHESCKTLGILASNVKILDNSSFLDGNLKWDFSVLLPELLQYVRKVNPDYIFTFDDYGVSGHTNHIATSDAVGQLYRYLQPSDRIPAIFELESVPFYRKYLSFMDTPFSAMSNCLSFTSSPSDVLKAQKAMLAHRSQLVWYRWLYISFSRYMIINTFKERQLEPPPSAS